VFRPSTVLGDSRFGATTQFDMVRAFVMLANMPVLPLGADWRMDIVPVDYVSEAIVTLHLAESPAHRSYNLSSGAASQTYAQIVDAMAAQSGRRKPVFAPALEGPFTRTMNALAGAPRGWPVTYPASLMKVFMPYLAFDTVFDNARVVDALGRRPTSFSEYAWPLFDFATAHDFAYPHAPWPEDAR
jgi:nucleoside-diphosphate-sugar epimerase